MLRKMRSKYNGRCKSCRRPLRIGDPILWSKQTGALCTSCGNQSPEVNPDARPPKQSNFKPSLGSHNPTGETTDFTMDWKDLKDTLRRVLDGDKPKMRARNFDVFRRHIVEPTETWNGYSGGQIRRWLKEGYRSEAIQGLTEFTPRLREKRRLLFTEDGDEFHLDLALGGDDKYLSEWTKREVAPGISFDAIITFAAHTDAKVVNAYNSWICRTVYSLQSAGIDCEVTLNFQTEDLIVGKSGLSNTRVKVKKENEVADFVSFSPMLSPAAFRGFLFSAAALHAESRDMNITPGIGIGPRDLQFGVSYDPESRKIIATSQRERATEFPEQRMIQEFRAALKAAQNGVQK